MVTNVLATVDSKEVPQKAINGMQTATSLSDTVLSVATTGMGDHLAETVVKHDLQATSDLAAMMLPVPKEIQVTAPDVTSQLVYKIFIEVFGMATNQESNLDTMSIALPQIKKQLEELERKVDKLLRADMETAKHRLQHAFHYLEDTETYPLAYREFEKVLDWTHWSMIQPREDGRSNNNCNALDNVWSKKLDAGQTVTFTSTQDYMELTFAIFVKEGSFCRILPFFYS